MTAVLDHLDWPLLLRLAGAGQLALAAGSLFIPRVLGWRADLATLRPLTRQMFWVYAGYILSFNVSFGLLSALAPDWLLEGSALAATVAAFIAAYWGARLVVQFAVLDRRAAPPGWPVRLGETVLVSLFGAFTTVYGGLAWHLGSAITR
jgi:hypothetical protein